jgi:PAS domain S-box-containing protein
MEPTNTNNALLKEIEFLRQQLDEKNKLVMDLELSRILMRKALDQSPVAMAVVSLPDYTLKIINKAMEHLLLISANEFLNKPINEHTVTWKYLYADGSPIAFENWPLMATKDGTGTNSIDIQIERHDGSRQWQLASAAPIYDKTGRLIAGILVMVDNSKHKEAQNSLARQSAMLKEQNEEYEALNEELNERNKDLLIAKAKAEENEMLYRKLIDNSPWGMHFYKIENNALVFKGANQAADKLLKIANDQFIGKTIEEAFPPLAQTEIPLRYRQAAESGTLWTTEQVNYEDNKISGAYEVIAFQTNYGNMVSVFNDITERKQHEHQLKAINDEIEAQNKEYQRLNQQLSLSNQELVKTRKIVEESEERFRLMLKNSNDSFVLIDKNGEQFFISDAAQRDTGFTIDELKGPIQNVILPSDLELVMQTWEKVLKSKNEVVRVQYRHKHKHKPFIWFEAAAQNYLDHPAINAVVVNVRDISEIKETEAKLIQAKEKAEENDRLKTAFLQNMSHEIRTPMNAIMGFANLLVYNYNDKEKLEQFSEIINNRCNDLLAIINDILDISKIESGQNDLHLEDCNINEIFAELALFFQDYQERNNKNHIVLNFHPVRDQSIALVKTDKIKLKQILINLITNALKYTESGKVDCGLTSKNHQLLFHVADTGIGIPIEKHGFIFERFSRIESTISNKIVGGTGLGLPIVKGLTGLLGGKVWLQSELNKGTTFFFSIQHNKSQTKTKPDNLSENHGQFLSTDKTILIVEDDQFNAMYLKEVLTGKAAAIYVAGSGMDAIKFALEKNVDIVLMDVRLPDISGYEATKAILKLKPGLKIIAQTAYAANDESIKALGAGCIDYISKPIKPEILLETLQKYI